MQQLMGFGGFSTTKGEKVMDNTKSAAAGGAQRASKREYRQYMNRKGKQNSDLH